jgi:hypothetical protein
LLQRKQTEPPEHFTLDSRQESQADRKRCRGCFSAVPVGVACIMSSLTSPACFDLEIDSVEQSPMSDGNQWSSATFKKKE